MYILNCEKVAELQRVLDQVVLFAGTLGSLSTTVERDQELLEGTDHSAALSENELLAVKWRCLYKKALLNAVDIAQGVLDTCT